jgi:BASS family bile acid:Na+ symporter
MGLQAIIGLLIQISLVLIVVAVGLQSRWSDVLYARKRPDLLWRGFVAVNVIVPATATVLCLLIPLPWLNKVAICLMAVSPLAPFTPGKMMKAGADTAFVNGLYVVLMLAAVIIVPVTIMLLDTISPQPVTVPEFKLVLFILRSVFLPLAIGLTIARFWPEFATKAAPIARKTGFAILIPLAILFIFTKFHALISLIGDGTVVTISAVVAAGILGGHFLGGKSPGHRAAMAQAAATRHPGIAAIIARRNFDDPQVLMAIVLFVLISVILCMIYARWGRRMLEHEAPAPPPGAAT